MDFWEWVGERAAEFDGPAWTTLVIGVAAFLISIYSLWRQRIQRPVFRLANLDPTWIEARPYDVDQRGQMIQHSKQPVVALNVTKYGGDLAEASISMRPLFPSEPWKAERVSLEVRGEAVYSRGAIVPCGRSRINFYICHIRFRLMATPRFNRHRFSIRRAKPSAD